MSPKYTPTLESSLTGNLMTRAPAKIRNFATKKENEFRKVNLSLSFPNLLFLSFSNLFFFLPFIVVVWLLNHRFLNLGPGPLSKVSRQQTRQG